MSLKVGIGLNEKAYTPEAYAYQNYLIKAGHQVQLVSSNSLFPDNDINIYFMGFSPFWEMKKQGKALHIHEYQSLSIPPHAKFKDYLKVRLNRSPHGRIFLNSIVQNALGFSDRVPAITRDMGVDEEFFNIRRADSAAYDIVYCGSFANRKGLVEELVRLANIGFKLLLIGDIDSDTRSIFERFSNITLYGRATRDELPELYASAHAGLNMTPDVYPFNIQTSTKTLEYLAAGLVLITNRYNWVERFCSHYHYTPVWLNEINNIEAIRSANSTSIDLSHLSWDSVLFDCRFSQFLENVLNSY